MGRHVCYFPRQIIVPIEAGKNRLGPRQSRQEDSVSQGNRHQLIVAGQLVWFHAHCMSPLGSGGA